MREIYEQILSIFWITVHHRWVVLTTAALVCFIGWAVVYILPDKYEVKATIYFDEETALSPVLKGVGTEKSSGDERASIIRRTLKNRASLLKIVDASGVDVSGYSDKALEKFLRKLVKTINIDNKGLSDGDGGKSGNFYTISFSHREPQFAYSVVNSTLELFIEKFIKTGTKENIKVEGFLDENIAEYKAKLEAAEEKLKQFKQKHPNLTQAKGEDFFSRLNEIRTNIDTAKMNLIEEQNRNFTLRSQLNRIISDSQNTAGAEIKAKELSLIEKRIQDANQKLTELKLQFTEKHPDVLATERILKQLYEQKKQEDLNPSPVSTTRKSSSLVSSELYQKLQLSVSESNSKVSALRARISEYEVKLDSMNKQITIMPEIESELVRLTRDYTNTKGTYDELVKRRSSSQISRQAEQSTQDLQYQVLDPPSIPKQPTFPNRRLLSIAVFFASFAIGILIAWLLEQFYPKIYREQQIEDELELEVYGNVPIYWSSSELAARRVGSIFYGLIVCGLVTCLAFVLDYYDFSFTPYVQMIKDIVSPETL